MGDPSDPSPPARDPPGTDDGEAEDPSGAIAAELAAEVDAPGRGPRAAEPELADGDPEDRAATVASRAVSERLPPSPPTEDTAAMPLGSRRSEAQVDFAAAQAALAGDGAGEPPAVPPSTLPPAPSAPTPTAAGATARPISTATQDPALERRTRPRGPTPTIVRAAMVALVLLPTAVVGLLLLLGAPTAALAALAGRDELEPNDVMVDAPHLVLGAKVDGLTCAQGDVDWFVVDGVVGKALVIDVKPGAEGRGGTSVHTARGVGLGASRQGAGEERVVVVPDRAEPLFVRVWGQRDPYSITPRVVDLPRRFEPNDDAAAATRVEPGAVVRQVECNGNDWFAVVVPPDRSLRAALKDAAPGLSISIGSPRATDVAPVTSAREVDAPAVGAKRTVLVHVTGSGGYDLDLALGAPTSGRRGRQRPVELTEFPGTFEPNDSMEQAALISPGRFPDLTCSGEDWFVVELAPGDGPVVLSTSTSFSSARGDLELELRSPTGETLAASRGVGDTESCQVVLREGGPVFIHVYNARNPYVLTVVAASDEGADALEPGEYESLQCTGNDLYSVQVPPGEVLTATARWVGNDGGVQVQLLDLDRSGIGGSAGTSSGPNGGEAHASTGGAPDGTVLVRVSGAPIVYDLSLVLCPVPSAPTVAAPAVGAPGEAFAPPVPARRLSTGVVPTVEVGDESWFEVRVVEGQKLQVILDFRNANGDIDCDLLDGAGNTVASSNSTQDRETLEFTTPRTQPMYVRAHCLGGRPNTARLTVTIDGSASLQRLEPGAHGGLECSGSAQYDVLVPQGKRVTVTISFDPARGDLDLALLDADGTVVASSDSLDATERVEWTAPIESVMTIRVDNARNTFDLVITLE